jgi:hypothetical protein
VHCLHAVVAGDPLVSAHFFCLHCLLAVVFGARSTAMTEWEHRKRKKEKKCHVCVKEVEPGAGMVCFGCKDVREA